MMEQMSRPEKPFDQPIGDIAAHLLAQGERPLEAPQSFAIRPPEHIAEFAQGLQRLTAVPYEFLISREPATQRWILTTGEEGKAQHHFDEQGDYRLYVTPECAHNHPPFFGVTHMPPSGRDLITVAQWNEGGHPKRLRLLLTPKGATLFGYEHAVSSLMIERLWESIRERYHIDVRDLESLRARPEQVPMLITACVEFAQKSEAIIRFYPWEDTEKVNAMLADYFGFKNT